MIDTVVMTIPMQATLPRRIKCDGSREWEGWEFRATGRGYGRYVKDAPPEDVARGMYFPLLTGYVSWRDGKSISFMHVQFSAPKLVFGHNLDELTERHFETVIALLQDRVSRMGVEVSDVCLRQAEIAKIHYSKNVILKRVHSASHVIGQLAKINANRRIEQTNVKYSNDGTGVQWYTKSHMISVYDKLAELERELDEETMEVLSQEDSIVRFEVRLTRKEKLRRLLVSVGHGDAFTFRKAFSLKVSKAVILHYWEKLANRDDAILFSRRTGPQALLRDIMLARRGIGVAHAIRLVGLLALAQDEGGMGGLRNTLALSKRRVATWYSLVKSLRSIGAALVGLRPEEWYEEMNAQLRAYKPVRLLGKIKRKIRVK
ncbi:hypothetical protein HYW59_03230 [Candidatus Kaiserbacteria bacterium]|nr:hypothetical protein [Candidatus Kaiserbacteria bacterium]